MWRMIDLCRRSYDYFALGLHVILWIGLYSYVCVTMY